MILFILPNHGNAINVTEEQKNDLVACSGGDGNLNEVVSGMMKSKKVLSATCRQEQQMICRQSAYSKQ